MDPIVLGSIISGIVLLLLGILALINSKRTRGLVLSISGSLAIAFPFAASYLLTR